MSFYQTETVSHQKYSFLSLICPGTSSVGDGKEIAVKTNNKPHKTGKGDSVDLTGCYMDNATIIRYLTGLNKTKEYEYEEVLNDYETLGLNSAMISGLYPGSYYLESHNIRKLNDDEKAIHYSSDNYKYHGNYAQKKKQITKIEAYASKQSICYSQTTVSHAINNIMKWFKEDALHYVFYFSGHGSKKNGGGLGFVDGVLTYNKIADLWLKYGPNYCTFIIDACYAEFIVDAFKKINFKKKQCGGCAEVVIYYGAKKNEKGCDQGICGGAFTNQLFGDKKNCNVALLGGKSDYKPKKMIHKYKDGSIKPQTPGMWKKNNWS